jgi:peptide/nickel transport system ATP-binding protein
MGRSEDQKPDADMEVIDGSMVAKENSQKPIIELRDVTKIYKTKRAFLGSSEKEVVALNQLSLAIHTGEIFGLVGESGSGKTTAGRLIVKLEDPDSGKLLMDGREITRVDGKTLKAFRRNVQMIFQDPYQSLNPQRSVSDTVSEPLVIHRTGSADARRDQVWEALKAVGLSPPEDFLYRYPHQLSGGQRQRVAIARAMILNPDFVVADEPTSMLDASISAQIFNILLGMRERLNITLLFITHSLAAARYLCDRIGVIYKGNLVEIGPAEAVIHQPKHPYTQALLDALPRFGDCGEVKRYGTLLAAERVASERVGCIFFPRCRMANRIKCSLQIPPLVMLSPSRGVACFYAEPDTEPVTHTDACFYTP